ncbi:hypothetical protein [Lysobacter sp. A3-1-A15]|uniref:hypothetical protein n=1 Tax=Novilysobacter viscosus TaxID=3098602 RepID=UPI002EDA93CE
MDGGVRSHHLLGRSDLPAISNARGLLVLPVLAWFATGRMLAPSVAPDGARRGGPVLLRWAVALAYGVGLSVAFTMGLEAVTPLMFQALFVVAVVLPLYRRSTCWVSCSA